jgi:hypothetical protein
MLWAILALLIVTWLVGVLTSRTLGGLIHGLPVVAVVLLVVRLVSGMVQSSLEAPGETEANNETLVGGS